MGQVSSFREFHNDVAMVCSSLETFFDLHADTEAAAVLAPSLRLLRESLDSADAIAGPDAEGS